MAFWTWAQASYDSRHKDRMLTPNSQGLEDKFDGTNRRNLRHFIVPGEADEIALHMGNVVARANQGGVSEDERAPSPLPDYYYMATGEKLKSSKESIDDEEPEKRQLVRIPTCAIFHKLSSGKGVPHSFVGKSPHCPLIEISYLLFTGFIRQWPALPRVVVRVIYSGPISCGRLTPPFLRSFSPFACSLSHTYIPTIGILCRRSMPSKVSTSSLRFDGLFK
jgi:hypothetical protein